MLRITKEKNFTGTEFGEHWKKTILRYQFRDSEEQLFRTLERQTQEK